MHPVQYLSSRGKFIATAVVFTIIFGGCLKFPIGDPETAKVDPSLAAAWFKRDDDGSVTVWNAQEYDARTYLVTQYSAKSDGGGGWERGGMSVSKAWIKKIGDVTFISMKVMSEQSDTPYVVFRVDLAGETLTARGIDPKFVGDNNVTDTAGLERLIGENLDNEALYLDGQKFERAGDADSETVKMIMKAFH